MDVCSRLGMGEGNRLGEKEGGGRRPIKGVGLGAWCGVLGSQQARGEAGVRV